MSFSNILNVIETSNSDIFRELGITLFVTVVIAAVVKISLTLIANRAYYEFYKHHTDFYKKSWALSYRTLYMRFPVPWTSETTFYLLDHAPMRKLFQRSPSLDAFGIARRLHWKVWNVPPTKYGTTFRQAAKQIHKELSAKNLTEVSERFEVAVLDDINGIRNYLGSSAGLRIPFHTRFYRVAYAANLKAIFGPEVPVRKTQIATQIFARCLRSLNSTPTLPILPTEWWNSILPGAREGKKARDLLADTFLSWYESGGMESASGSWKNIMKVLADAKVSLRDTSKWINLVFFGFQGNTGEQPGWALIYLLQSPKLLAAVIKEVDALPVDTLVGTDFRRVTPYLHSVIHETLRLSTATLTGRVTTQAIKLEGCDKVFPQGSLIRIMSRASAFDPRVWGDDANFWKGDRFVQNEALYREELAFGGGVSACPGRHFALAELELLMCHVLRNFAFDPASLEMRVRLPPEAEDMDMGRLVDEPSQLYDIIDLDGARRKGVYPGVMDAENCMESVSGSLIPKFESTCVVKARPV